MTATPSPLVGERRQVKPYSLHGVLTMIGAIRATGSTWYKGWLLGRDSTGKLDVITERPDMTGAGYAEKDEQTAGDGTLEGNGIMYPDSILMAVGDEFTDAMAPCAAYGVSNQEVGATAYGASSARSPIGVFLGLDPQDSTRAMVWLGATAAAVVKAMLGTGSAGKNKARLVVTSLSASYTGSKTAVLTGPASTAWPTQDGITNANQRVGDTVFIQEGTTNLADPADAGPWVIANLAASAGSWILVRPAWWRHGATIDQAAVIEIGGDGTGTNPTLAGTEWKTFCQAGKVIGSDAPVFWPKTVICAVTLASGTLASPRTTIPVRHHLQTGFLISSDPTTAPHASTKLWRVSALTTGVTGSSSVQVVAESAPGTTNTSDVGQYNIVATNW